MSRRSGWCLPSGNRDCYDHDECTRRGGCDGCPEHTKDTL